MPDITAEQIRDAIIVADAEKPDSDQLGYRDFEDLTSIVVDGGSINLHRVAEILSGRLSDDTTEEN